MFLFVLNIWQKASTEKIGRKVFVGVRNKKGSIGVNKQVSDMSLFSAVIILFVPDYQQTTGKKKTKTTSIKL